MFGQCPGKRATFSPQCPRTSDSSPLFPLLTEWQERSLGNLEGKGIRKEKGPLAPAQKCNKASPELNIQVCSGGPITIVSPITSCHVLKGLLKGSHTQGSHNGPKFKFSGPSARTQAPSWFPLEVRNALPRHSSQELA